MIQVSILINCYNGEKYLQETLDSVYSQTYKNWEIIFIDNCSTDRSKAIAKSYDHKIKYYKTEKNIPLGAARKYGLSLCQSKYIAFLDTDDLWREDKLEQQVSMLEGNINYAYCYSDYEIIDPNNKHISFYKTKHPNGFIFKKLLVWYEIGMLTVLMRREVLNTLEEGFDSSLTFCPDYDLFMRLAIANKVCSIKKCLAKYRNVPNSLSVRTKENHYKEIYSIYVKIHKIIPNIATLYPNEYVHWQAWISKTEADNIILFQNNLEKARQCLKKASMLSERQKKRYEISLKENGLNLLKQELRNIEN